MIQQIFAIFDDKALLYSPPFFQITKGLAVRAFTQTAEDKNTTIGLHPTDFTLFHIGEYDDSNAKISCLTTPVSIMKASETGSEVGVINIQSHLDGRGNEIDLDSLKGK